MKPLQAFIGTAFLSCASALLVGAEKEEKGSNKPLEEQTSVTEHSVVIDGTQYDYQATAGTLLLKDEEEEPKASFFYIAYHLKGVRDSSDRPITFSFNGGPGSSSVWLHLGLLGPKRVVFDPEGRPTPPPFDLVSNEFSLLDRTDLVFIDPVSTGFSRAAPEEDPKQFHGVRQDIESVGDFIRLYTSRKDRWASPKFLIGESYGTTRAAGLSGYLQDRHGLYLNGVMLVSSVLNFQTIRFHEGNDLPFILFLPGYTATAWYHNALSEEMQDRSLEDALSLAEDFAIHEYAQALLQGHSLDAEQREEIIQTFSRFTGLSQDYVRRSNLRVPLNRFAKELLRDRNKTVGRLDSRFLGMEADLTGEAYEYDPSYAAIQGSYTAALNHYVGTELKFESDLPYEILTSKVRPWDYSQFSNQYLNVADTLREAITKNQFLKVFVASGYFDLATPYFATDYTLDHIRLPKELRNNITVQYYKAGHMMYIKLSELKKMKEHLSTFLEASLGD